MTESTFWVAVSAALALGLICLQGVFEAQGVPARSARPGAAAAASEVGFGAATPRAEPFTANAALAEGVVSYERLPLLVGSQVFAGDNTPLGRISKSTSDAESMANHAGAHGSPDGACSVFNRTGAYGSATSPWSAFNQTTGTPPFFFLPGTDLPIYLTANPALSPRVDPYQLKAWFESLRERGSLRSGLRTRRFPGR